MSTTKIIEGVEYIQKDHVDEIVRQRIAKYSERLAQSESKLSEYESQLDEARSKMGLVDTLSTQLESMRRVGDRSIQISTSHHNLPIWNQ